MAKLIAKKRIPYRGRILNPGDEFDVSCLRTKRALIALGKATPVNHINVASSEIEMREEPQVLIESEPDLIEVEMAPIEFEPDPIELEPDPIESEAKLDEPEEKSEDSEEILPKTGKKRRAYKRRDMTAEEIKETEDD